MVAFSNEALDALDASRRDARFTTVKALEMAQRIVARCNRLDHRPHGGYKGRKPGTFEIVIKPFIIVFEIAGTEVIILNIWHGRENREQVWGGRLFRTQTRRFHFGSGEMAYWGGDAEQSGGMLKGIPPYGLLEKWADEFSVYEAHRFPRLCIKSDGFRKRSTHPTLAVSATGRKQHY